MFNYKSIIEDHTKVVIVCNIILAVAVCVLIENSLVQYSDIPYKLSIFDRLFVAPVVGLSLNFYGLTSVSDFLMVSLNYKDTSAMVFENLGVELFFDFLFYIILFIWFSFMLQYKIRSKGQPLSIHFFFFFLCTTGDFSFFFFFLCQFHFFLNFFF